MENDVRSLLCYKLFVTVRENERLIDEQLKALKLTRTQWRVLIRFNFLEPPFTQQKFLKSLDIDRAHLTRALDQLEERKLICRTRLAHDKRAFNLAVTSEGKQVAKKIERILKHQSSLLTDGLSEKEKEQFNKSLQKITANLLAKGK